MFAFIRNYPAFKTFSLNYIPIFLYLEQVAYLVTFNRVYNITVLLLFCADVPLNTIQTINQVLDIHALWSIESLVFNVPCIWESHRSIKVIISLYVVVAIYENALIGQYPLSRDNRGICLIICNKSFKKSELGLEPRTGSAFDSCMCNILRLTSFGVIVLKFARWRHVITIYTHGQTQWLIFL